MTHAGTIVYSRFFTEVDQAMSTTGMSAAVFWFWIASLLVTAYGLYVWKVRKRLSGRHMAYAGLIAMLLAQLARFFVAP